MLRAVVQNVLVDFVGDAEGVPAHAKVANEFELRAGKNFSGGIVGRVQDDGFGSWSKGRGQFPFVVGPIRSAQFYEAWRSAAQDGVRPIILVVRLEDNDFIAGINDGHHGGHHRFGGTAADGDFTLGIDANSLSAFEFFHDGVAQRFRAPGDGVLIDVVGDGLAGGFLDFCRRGKIRKTLR